MFTLEMIQDIIARENPHEHYATYREHEALYWDAVYGWLFDHCAQNKVANVLDLGIAYGTLGLFVRMNTGAVLYGVDFFKYMSDELIRKYDIRYWLQNIELDMLYFPVIFDVVIFTEIAEHLNFNIVSTLKKVVELMSNDGVLYLSTPDVDSWGRLDLYESWKDIPLPSTEVMPVDKHIYIFSEDELKYIFDLVGLRVDKFALSAGINGARNLNYQLRKG